MKNNEFVIYHNVPDEKVYIKVPEGIETHFQLQNLAGKVLQEATHAKSLHDFDLTGLSEGNYFILINQDDVIKSKKIRIES